MKTTTYGSRPLLSRSGCILVEKNEEAKNYNKFSSPFIEERLYLMVYLQIYLSYWGSRPLLSRSGCISIGAGIFVVKVVVLVPFYRGAVVFKQGFIIGSIPISVLVPFYRGAVVFVLGRSICITKLLFSSPFIEERLYFAYRTIQDNYTEMFSSPFIEERLYLQSLRQYIYVSRSSRPLLSRSGCISNNIKEI